MTALRELAERKYSDAQLTEVARALCRDNSQVCNVNNDDNWKMYSEDYIAQAHVALAALAAVKILDAEGDGGAVDGWIKGYPNHVYASEWFIAETVYNDRVVLRALSEENSYDFTTADHTYMSKENIKRWMQFPDSDFIPSTHPQPVRSGVVSDLVSALKEISEIRWSYAATNGCAHTAAMTAKAALEHFAKSQGESNV